MMNPLFNEYTLLIKDTLIHLKEKKTPFFLLLQPKLHPLPINPIPKISSQKQIPVIEEKKILPEQKIFEEPQPLLLEKTRSSSKKEIKSLKPILQLIQKVSPHTKLIIPSPPILILTSNKQSDEFLFLEKIAHAISTFLLPAAVITPNALPPFSKVLTLKLILANTSLLKEIFQISSEKIHDIVAEKHQIAFFALHEVKHYLDNTDQKRILWNSLKSLQNLFLKKPL